MDDRWLDAAARKARYEPEANYLFVGCRDGQLANVLSLGAPGGNHAVVALLVAPHLWRTGVARATMLAIRDAFPESTSSFPT